MSIPLPRGTGTDRLWTEAEFLALPESNQRRELIDGELVCDSADFGHQARVGHLFEELRRWARTRTPRPDVGLSALDVRMAPGRILQPDVFVHLQPLPRPVTMPISVVPDLCIEVASTNRIYDRVTKRAVYAEAGVREFWIVIAQFGFVERFTGPALHDREELRDRLVTPLLPGFELDIPSLLAEP